MHGKLAFTAKAWPHYGTVKRAKAALRSPENKRRTRNNNCIAVFAAPLQRIEDVNAVSRGTPTSQTTTSVKWLELAAEMNGRKCLTVKYEILMIDEFFCQIQAEERDESIESGLRSGGANFDAICKKRKATSLMATGSSLMVRNTDKKAQYDIIIAHSVIILYFVLL